MCVDVQDLVDEGSVFFSVLSDTAVCFMQGGGV